MERDSESLLKTCTRLYMYEMSTLYQNVVLVWILVEVWCSGLSCVRTKLKLHNTRAAASAQIISNEIKAGGADVRECRCYRV